MRRPVMYLAGLVLATGASLALAGPANAAVSDGNCHHPNHHNWYYDDDEDGFDSFYYSSNSNGSGNEFHGISILSGNGGIL